jgi:hypothetical protein
MFYPERTGAFLFRGLLPPNKKVISFRLSCLGSENSIQNKTGIHLLAYHLMRDYIINKERRRQNDEAYVC